MTSSLSFMRIQSCDLKSPMHLIPNHAERLHERHAPSLISNYLAITNLAQAALKGFLQGNFPDPLVGENACHIRAVIYCRLAQDQIIMRGLNELCELFEKVFTHSPDVQTLKRYISLREVVESHRIDIPIPEALQSVFGLIFFGHVLTLSKRSIFSQEKSNVVITESNDYRLLPELTTTFAKELIKKARRSMSEFSVQFLQQEATLLSLSSRYLDSKLVMQDSLGLFSFSALPSIQILLESMKAHQTAIVLKVRTFSAEKEFGTITLFFNTTKSSNAYQVVKIFPKWIKRPLHL